MPTGETLRNSVVEVATKLPGHSRYPYTVLQPKQSHELGITDFETGFYRLVIGVGCQKAGTTSISKFLVANGLKSSGKKELHAFQLQSDSRPVSRVEYLRALRAKPGKDVFGEFTPNYLAHPSAIWNLHTAVPEAKIIVSVRNPIHRAFSAYTHAVGAGKVPRTLSFPDAVDSALRGATGHWIPGLITEGLYSKGIERLLHFYPRDRVLIVNYDRWTLPTNSGDFEEQLLEFAGLERLTQEPIRRENSGGIYRAKKKPVSDAIDDRAKSKLRACFQRSKTELEQLLDEDLGWW
jgi:hypothetical protein